MKIISTNKNVKTADDLNPLVLAQIKHFFEHYTTGVAGPDGGTDEKPVGLVYIGLFIKGNIYVKKVNLRGDRQRVRAFATSHALDFLRRTLKVPVCIIPLNDKARNFYSKFGFKTLKFDIYSTSTTSPAK